MESLQFALQALGIVLYEDVVPVQVHLPALLQRDCVWPLVLRVVVNNLKFDYGVIVVPASVDNLALLFNLALAIGVDSKR